MNQSKAKAIRKELKEQGYTTQDPHYNQIYKEYKRNYKKAKQANE